MVVKESRRRWDCGTDFLPKNIPEPLTERGAPLPR